MATLHRNRELKPAWLAKLTMSVERTSRLRASQWGYALKQTCGSRSATICPVPELILEILVRGITPMTRISAIAVAFSLASATMFSSQASYAQAKPGVERLYILNCGEGVAGDISRWSPGVSVGSVILVATPGHTPGHQSLLIKLPKSGALLLSGDAVHFKDNWENRRVPDINFNKEQTSASLQRIADILAKEKAQLWINHDKVQRDSLK